MDTARRERNEALYKSIDVITYALLIVGALLWGMVGYLGPYVAAALFGQMNIPIRLLFGLVGIAALYDLFSLPSMARRWEIHLRHHPAHA